MRRLFIILLAVLVPFQAAWSAGHAAYGHGVSHAATADAHGHDHDHDHDADRAHHDAAPAGVDLVAGGGEAPVHGDDGHHHCHVHPAFSMILPDGVAGLAYDAGACPPLPRATFFTSHIPPLFDRPPAALG